MQLSDIAVHIFLSAYQMSCSGAQNFELKDFYGQKHIFACICFYIIHDHDEKCCNRVQLN